MRFLTAAALLLAMLAAVPAAAQVEGRWRMISINGDALPAESVSGDGAVVRHALFSFGPDGRLSVTIQTDTENKGQATQSMTGTYTTRGDTLTLTGEAGSTSVTDLRWVRQGDTLQLYVENENAFRLVREPDAQFDAQAAAGDGEHVQSGEPWTPGTWNAVQVNGRHLPAPWPRSPEMTVTGMTFTFTADGQATVRILGVERGEQIDEESTARYRVDGDRLTILEESGGVDEAFTWTLQNGTLRMVDARGDVYTLAHP
jgi:hypothetical protein